MAEGLISDCRLLLSRFENLKTVRFEKFCEVWREMNFSLIHCGAKDINRRTQLVDYLFRIISTYLDSTPCSFQYRIGALYALYAIYYTQLNQPKVKIRMTLAMMKDLKELHKRIIEQQPVDEKIKTWPLRFPAKENPNMEKHHDADYILRRLYKENSFLFVAMPIPLAFGSKEAITSQEEGQSSGLIDDVNDDVEERFRALEYLEEAHKNYKELKSSLLESGTIPSLRSFSAISDDLVTDVASELQKFDDWKRTRCQKHVLERTTGTLVSQANSGKAPSLDGQTTSEKETRTSTEPLSAAKKGNTSKSLRVNEIKKKSFSTVSKVSKSMRHLQPSKETEEEGSKPKKKRQKK